MVRYARIALAGIAVSALAACADTSTPTSPVAPRAEASPTGQLMRFTHAHVCPGAAVGSARCHSLILVDASGKPAPAAATSAYGPVDLQAAYGLTTAAANNGSTATIAIVDAYDDPKAESDLGVYRSHYGLPACTSSTGCFSKVNQSGGTSYPTGDTGWAEEISLDLDMASAICPNCKILLVEATSNSFANLSAAVNYAATVSGVVAISNSYGGSEYSGEVSAQSAYNHPGIAVTVSSGDNGYGVEFPAASQYVTAVGGTSLTRSTSTRGWTETVWNGAGSGCSRYVVKPAWQHDTGCTHRTVADVAAVADPNTGVVVYDSYGITPGFYVFGGTSVAAPIIAAVYALAGNTAQLTYAQSVYTNAASLFDVTSGRNGRCRQAPYLCTGEVGYDGPTGNGTPNGLGAF